MCLPFVLCKAKSIDKTFDLCFIDASMNERDYIRLKKQINERYQRDLEALERVWQMAQESNGLVSISSSNRSYSSGDNVMRNEGLTEAIRSALRTFDDPFTVHIVINRVSELFPDLAESVRQKPASVSSALKRLEKFREIEVIRVGSGKRPSEYRTINVMDVTTESNATPSKAEQIDRITLTGATGGE